MARPPLLQPPALLRTIAPLAAVAFLAAAMTVRWGFFDETALACALLALALAMTALPSEPGAPPLLVGLLGALALGFAVYGLVHPYGYFRMVPLPGLRLASAVGFLATGALLAGEYFALRGRFLFVIATALLFLSGAALRAIAVRDTPDPAIDVYTCLDQAPTYLLRGQNPYTGTYQWPYDYPPDPQTEPLPAYPPLPFLLALPFRACHADVRYANLVCDLLAAFVLLAAGAARGDVRLGALAAAAYLHFPNTPFMAEQCWYEPMLAATLGGGLWLAERGRRAGFFLTGLGLTGKQYGVVLFWPLLAGCRRHRRAFLLGLLAAAAVTLLPFFLGAPRPFLDVVLLKHLNRPVRSDSLSLPNAAVQLLGVTLPRPLGWGLAAGLIAWISWRTPRRPLASAFGAGTALLAFCLCHSQGFFNYFYLCEYLFLLGIVGSRARAPCPRAP